MLYKTKFCDFMGTREQIIEQLENEYMDTSGVPDVIAVSLENSDLFVRKNGQIIFAVTLDKKAVLDVV